MLIQPLINPRSVRQAAMGRVEPEMDVRESMADGCTGTIIRVYPIGHPDNRLARLLADVHVSDRIPILRKVPIESPHAHQETEIASPDTRDRNPYAPKKRNRIDGSAFDLRPGTKVWVQFMRQERHEPVVTGTVKFNYQGDLGFPAEKMVVFPFSAGGEDVAAAERYPLDSHLEEYPRAVPFQYNGVRAEIDNRGNLHLQSSIDREAVFPGDNQIPGSPSPQGSLCFSTKGAAKGNQGRFTGKHPSTGETNDQGNIVDESKEAAVGKHLERLIQNGNGSRLLQLLLNAVGNSDITLEQNGQGSYSLTVAQNGVGSWIVLVKDNGEGRWGVTIQDNPDGSATLDVHDNGDGSRKVTLESNGTGDYEVNTGSNGSGAHRHTSTSDADGHMERTILGAGEGSLLDTTENAGRGVAYRKTKSCGDGSIYDRTELGALGRLDRKSVVSTDGTIRDHTEASVIGHIIHRTRSLLGRMWASTKGSVDGRVYFEDMTPADPDYLSLRPAEGTAELHASLNAVMDSIRVSLGSRFAPYNLTLWPQLYEAILLLCAIFDTHTHAGVQTGGGNTLVPSAFQTPVWVTNGPNSRSDVIFGHKEPGPLPSFEEDPDLGAPL